MTRVALLWHMHQPFYVDRATGIHVLPWVRLHALKDYWGMVALTREFPSLRVTFNLVPSLLEQLEAFASDTARDPHLDIGLRDAAALSPEDARLCAEEFFHAHYGRMIAPHTRYAELHARRDEWRRGGPAFTVDELRDLQVWHKLVWIDPLYRLDPRIDALHAKGRGYSEADKATLRSVELEILRRVVPEYRDASGEGRVELSTSPYYHPILPLLCDLSVYRGTHPAWPPPEEPFQYPEDSDEQLARGIALHERLFGQRPLGVWPSEGAVSDAMVSSVARQGLSWMATDEAILGQSLGLTFGRESAGTVQHADVLYRPYRLGTADRPVACGFRDHALSDLIGFSYATWDAEAAAHDFVRRLDAAGASARSRGAGDPTVFVILDGENAWEHYDGQGRPFLRALYRALTTHEGIRTVTMREACADATEPLASIAPGSWIHGDFYIWAGHADDRRAWGQLARARQELARTSPTHSGLAAARESLLVAEGSDWFWWYGDDHSSDHDRVFDELFRRHLQNVYRALATSVPDDLWRTNISTDAAVRPTGPVSTLFLQLDGEESSYLEWLGAGWFETRVAGGAMERVAVPARRLEGVRYGFDEAGNLVVCLVPATDRVRHPDTRVRLTLGLVPPLHIVVTGDGVLGADGRGAPPGVRAAVGSLIEIWIASEHLGLATRSAVPMAITIEGDGRVDSWSVEFSRPSTDPDHWRA